MKLKDILFDENDYTFLCGECYGDRELSGICLVSSAGDLTSIQPNSLLLFTDFISSPDFHLDLLFLIAMRSHVSGIVFMNSFNCTLTDRQRQKLTAHAIFVIALPPEASSHSIVYQVQNGSWSVYNSDRFHAFRSQLLALCARPYTALDVAVLLNKALGRSVDLIVGKELTSLTQHDTLGITNVIAVLSKNLSKILSNQHPQIYYNRNSRALFFHIRDLYAFYAVPLGDENTITDLEIAILRESIPYIALPLSRYIPPCPVRSSDNFYLNILRGTLTMDSLSLRETASALGINSDTPRFVWILDWQGTDQSAIQAPLAQKVKQRFPSSFIHKQESRLVVITPASELRLNDQTCISAFRVLLSDCWEDFPTVDLRISFSKICASLKHLKNAYTEAKFSMILGPKLNPQKHIHDYQSYILYQILCDSWGIPVLKRVHDNIIIPLQKYDEISGQCLLPTLEHFASCAFNITRTAEAMQVHRNTLYRRSTKIGNILNQDMTSTNTHILLYIALRISHIYKVFPQTEKNMSWNL